MVIPHIFRTFVRTATLVVATLGVVLGSYQTGLYLVQYLHAEVFNARQMAALNRADAAAAQAVVAVDPLRFVAGALLWGFPLYPVQ